MNVNLKKFDPRKITNDRICVFIGKRGTGKTSLVSDILSYHKDIPMGVAISGTEDGNSYYSGTFPDLLIHTDYKPEIVENIIDRQKGMIRQCPKIKRSRADDVHPADICFLMDDMMFDKSWTRDPGMRAIFMNGRHWNILFFLTMQYMLDIPPAMRANIDYLFILKENKIQDREKLYKNFFGIFPTKEMFYQVLDKCTENYECLVLDNTSTSHKIEDVVFWYKAKLGLSYRIGSKELWNHCSKNYDKDYYEHSSSRKTSEKLSSGEKLKGMRIKVKKKGSGKKKRKEKV